MSIEVVIKQNDFPALAKATPDKANKAIRAAALDGEAFVKRSMADSPAGATGRSSPGNPPRIDTGHLVNSIGVRQLKKMLWAIRCGADYGIILEYGTTFVTKHPMEARPFMTPMSVYVRKQLPTHFKNFLD